MQKRNVKVAIVHSSDISTKDCMAAERFCDMCFTCDKVMRCKMKEARRGRFVVIKKKLDEANAIVMERRKEFRKAIEEMQR